MEKDTLRLKWGTIKGYNLHSKAALAAADAYFNTPCSQTLTDEGRDRETDEQKIALCNLIDALNCETVRLDWTAKDVSKQEAKQYIMEYGSK